MITTQLRSVLLSALALSAACGGPADPEPAPAPPASDEGVTLTSVTWDERGAAEVSVRRITRQEQAALAAARLGQPAEPATGEVGALRQPLTVDPGCRNPSSMWLYDGPGQTGNMLCLLPNRSLSDSANLSAYFRTVLGACPLCYNAYWGHAVKSYWTPAYNAAITPAGGFFQGPGASPCYSYWQMDGRRYEANACAQSANILGTYDIH